MTRFVAILGPTASGKSAMALELASRVHGEIVTCDSQQIYIGMDIGTGKPTREERRQSPHHLLDLVHPDERFHAARWVALARVAIDRIASRGRLPIVVGGTGLYYRALTSGLFAAPAPDPFIRARHRDEAERMGVEALHERLVAIDPVAAVKISRRDLVRISRALEVFEQTGVPISELRRDAEPPPSTLAAYTVVLDPPVAVLRQRIEHRLGQMLKAGFVDEVRALRAAGYGPALRPLQALGYKQLGAFVDGVCKLEQAVSDTLAATVAYARRQRTWFRKEVSVARLAAPQEEHIDHLVNAIEEIRAS
ncbi:MAG TPA: tRNA (adenosine(37)-N6)-dimethylallyltransferase MiaA [Polyangia bacterium]|nr:tRNA (adenosine(37)-N6)-dimethylallyltransferase MiaA [Polyangia bacterium]